MKDVVFLPQHFRQQGYLTARVGKIFHVSRNDRVNMDDPFSWDETINEPIAEGRAKIGSSPASAVIFRAESLDWAAKDRLRVS